MSGWYVFVFVHTYACVREERGNAGGEGGGRGRERWRISSSMSFALGLAGRLWQDVRVTCVCGSLLPFVFCGSPDLWRVATISEAGPETVSGCPFYLLSPI